MTPATRQSLRTWLVTGRMPLILVILVITATLLTDGVFIKPDNLVNIARQISFEGLIALGMTLVIITGGIDLSVGSLVAISGVVAAIIMRALMGNADPREASAFVPIVAGLAGGIGVGAGIGAVSGAIIARFMIPPFIVTLSAMLMARGFAFIICNGQPIHELPLGLMKLGRGFVLPDAIGQILPIPVVIFLAGYGLLAVLLNRTTFGRGVIAVGSNEEAARLAGVPVARTKLLVYLATGALAGLAGTLHVGKLMAGDPKVGEMWELNVIAAVVVGGTSLFGGRGTMTGTLLGALIIGVLNNSLNLLNVQHFWQKVSLGAVILAASLFDVAMRKLED